MSFPLADIARLASEYATREPQDVLALALEHFDGNIAISFSGGEDVALIDMASKLRPGAFSVFSLDTGRIHGETYRFIDKVRERYNLTIDVLSPDTATVERLVREKGLFSFYKDGHQECCSIRKVMPLKRKLATLASWVTGLRKDQNPSTRSSVPVIQEDTAFSTPARPLVKFNPFANWASAQVWSYIRKNDVPYNELHMRGYVSIGCEPCSRPTLPNQPERDGRWWWEDATIRECGLHVKPKANR